MNLEINPRFAVQHVQTASGVSYYILPQEAFLLGCCAECCFAMVHAVYAAKDAPRAIIGNGLSFN